MDIIYLVFDEAEGNVTYLSRAGRFANLEEAKAAPASLELEEPYLSEYHLNSNFDKTTYLNDDDVMPTTGAENGMKLADLRGADYDDPRWEELLDQLTVEEMQGMIAMSGYQTPAIDSVGREIYLKPFEISVKMGKANAVMVSWSFLGHRWTGENSGLLNTVLRDEWGFRGMALTDFFRNNGHGFMNADSALANSVDAMLSTFDGAENNVANPDHPTSGNQMRRASKNVMYTVVNSWAYDGDIEKAGMETWKKAAIGIDVILVLALAALEIMVVKGMKNGNKINRISNYQASKKRPAS